MALGLYASINHSLDLRMYGAPRYLSTYSIMTRFRRRLMHIASIFSHGQARMPLMNSHVACQGACTAARLRLPIQFIVGILIHVHRLELGIMAMGTFKKGTCNILPQGHVDHTASWKIVAPPSATMYVLCDGPHSIRAQFNHPSFTRRTHQSGHISNASGSVNTLHDHVPLL